MSCRLALLFAEDDELLGGSEGREQGALELGRRVQPLCRCEMRLLKRFGSLHAAIQSSGPGPQSLSPGAERGAELRSSAPRGESSVSFLKFSDLLKLGHSDSALSSPLAVGTRLSASGRSTSP